MAKIVIKTKEVVEKEVDVTFPIYLESSDAFETSSYVTRYQILENGSMISVGKTTAYSHGTVEFKIEKRTINLHLDLGGMLTMDKSSSKEFHDLLTEMTVEMSSVANS